MDEIFSNEKNKEKKWGEFLIVGGDDVCAVFDPTLVLKISNEFQKLFEIKMLKLMNEIAKGEKNKENTCKKELPDILKNVIANTRITSSSGVVIAKTKTPMFQLFKQGLKLQKNAKKERKEVKKIFPSTTTGFIDFQVIGAEGTVNIDSFRSSLSNIMDRPYAIDFNIESNNEEDRNKKNVKNLDSLLKLIHEMKRINFPTNKLRYIYDLKRNLNLDDTKKKINFINILSKMNQEHIKFIVNDLELDYKDPNTFENNFNNIFDILEIYDFIEEKEEKTNEN